MNLKEIRDSCRLRLDDNNRDKYLWSDAELNGYINQAINEAAIRSRSILDSTTNECCIINCIAGTANYPIHDAVFEIKRVYDSTNERVLKKTSFEELDEKALNWVTQTGNAEFYLVDLNHYGEDGDRRRTLTLYCNPDADLTLNLSVYRTPLFDITDMDPPEIPVFQHDDLIYWVMHLAYMKQDVDTLNADRSLIFEQRFANCFGEKQDARKLEWRRKRTNIRVTGNFM